jgi:predicted glycosyltransferase
LKNNFKILFHLGHPAHFHLFKNPIKHFKSLGHQVKIVIKKKDVLEQLLIDSGLEYTNLMKGERGDKKWQIALSLLKRDWAMLGVVNEFKPNLMLGTTAEISHIGFLKNIPSLVVNEDDAEVVPLFAKLAYPLATAILAPNCCSVGRWEKKKIGYEGYHELSYLHPNNFVPNPNVIKEYNLGDSYFIIRFAKLNAHHDVGRNGISTEIARGLIQKLTPHGKVWITSERELEPEFEPYRIMIPSTKIHDVMAFANIYIGDSQTMAAEAAVLGVPAIRFNDFVGEISYLNELENTYKLGFGIPTAQKDKLFETVDNLLQMDYKADWRIRQKRMLSEKIDTAQQIIEVCFKMLEKNKQ